MVCVAAIPFMVTGSFYLFLFTFAGVYLLAAMGFNVLAGYMGIISLAHGAVVAIGAFTTAILTVTYGWSFWPAAVMSTLVGGAVSGLVALPALRLSSWYFVLITIAFTTAVTAVITDMKWLTGGFTGILGVPPPSIAGHKFSGREMFWLVMVINIAVWWVISNIVHSRIGWSLLAIRDSSISALSNGVSVSHTRLFAFVFAGATAGLAGALFAVLKIVVTPEDFPFHFSIFFLFVVVLGGPAYLWGPLLGVFAFYVLPEMLGSLREYRMLIYGVGLLAFSIVLPEGIAGGLVALRRRYGASSAKKQSAQRTVSQITHAIRPIEGVALKVEDVSKTFGGVNALSNVTISVPAGHIHAVVGPNGSGKTTLLNIISGLYEPSGGDVRLGDKRITGLRPHMIARAGVGRTFQTPKIIGHLSVLENIRFGAYHREKSSGLSIALSLPSARREAEELTREATELLALVGLSDRAYDRADELPHGQLRLLEIGRALVGRPRVLLLDEPAAGLSLHELERLEELMIEIRRLGVTLIMVEHHVELVMGVAQSATVLDGGKVLAAGTPEQVFADKAVVSAYTGAPQ
ncbi:MAG: hypothetical protein BGP06_05135 [Rhizobiales bacterium 65-9]|nr:MAG: hypothetical protein BGP06_05135 [Rhizobiales bacterium 65-9]